MSEKLIAIENENKTQESTCEEIEKKIDLYQLQIDDINERINIIPVEMIDIGDIENFLEENKKEKDLLTGRNKKFFENIENNNELLDKIGSFLDDDFDIEEVKNNKSIVVDKQNQLNLICNDIKLHETKLKVKEGKASLLEEVPCGEEFSHCKFIKDAYGSLKQLDEVRQEIANLRDVETKTSTEIQELDPEKIEEHIEKHDKLIEKQNELNSENSSYELEIQKNKTKIVGFKKEIENLNEKVIEYNKNKLAIENLEALNFEKDNFLRAIVKEKENLSEMSKPSH